jgi:ATP-dependent 26S proteasome regulatory subunit
MAKKKNVDTSQPGASAPCQDQGANTGAKEKEVTMSHSMSNKLKTYLKSGYAALFAVTYEEERITKSIAQTCQELGVAVYTWTPTVGITEPDGITIIEKFNEKKTSDPMTALFAFVAVRAGKKGELVGAVIPNKAVLVLKDMHIYLKKGDPVMTRLVKDAIAVGRTTNRAIIVMGCQLTLPPELEKEFTVLDFPLPSRPELLEVAQELSGSKGVAMNGDTDEILDAGVGLTTTEFADAVAASLTEHNQIVPAFVAELKAQTIKKTGILEIIKPGVTFDNLGGLHELKGWISKRRHAFGKKAQEYGLPVPKGVVLFGVQGAGKSFATRAIASELNVPLVRLDTGRLFGGLVGQSESNVRSVIAQVEAFGRCVLQIDEIDKGFAGMVGGHDGDSGTTRRVIGAFLTWMAEKTSPVFIVATANDLTKLPPELLRKGRWDEMFFLDLPTHSERVEIWNVQIKRQGRKPGGFDVEALAGATDKWTGAEIEALFSEGLFAAFDQGKEPDTELLVELSKNTMPLSKTMAEQLAGLRNWADGRCRMASTHEKPEAIKGGMKFQ